MTSSFFKEQSSTGGKRERTRSALLDSAISVIAAKGFEATRINDVTEHAGLANGTFYNYFDSKEALLNEAAMGVAIELARQIDEGMADIDDASVRVVTATAKVMETARREPEWFAVLLEGVAIVPAVQDTMVKFLRQDIELGIEQGQFDVTVDVLLINQVLALMRTAFLVDRALPETIIRRTCESQLRLLGVPPRRAAGRVTRILDRLAATSIPPDTGK